MKKRKPEILLRDTYLTMIENAPGTQMFWSLFVRAGRRKTDILRQGELSCAYFVSSVLKLHGLVGDLHATVVGTVRDMEQSGWKKARSRIPKRGDVIVWASQKLDGEQHKHIGFSVGKRQAVSTSYAKRKVVRHHDTYGGKRKIEAVFWNPKLIR